ncbi:MAG: DegT/DnrJ/EryC1/StrS family aminotransferase [Magnetococcales bacterium]|nr:DegT/DnrJ/EryC1/StrS family aminotransferase [Magnetococcales bacterium]
MQFIDLQAQYQAYRGAIDAAIQGVLDSSQYINGPQVAELEAALARFVGCAHAVGVSSGTDSLRTVLMAWEVGPGDEVVTSPFTFIATVEVILALGATPVFVDVEPDTLNIDPRRIEAALTPRTKVILPVSLFGQCADLEPINALARAHGLRCLEDACQSLGATSKGRRSGALTDAAATSFFPAKPLGCYGDGGMVFTDDDELARRVQIIRDHGQVARYRHAKVGLNARLDTLQAAILLAKLKHFPAEIEARQRVAARYMELLAGHVELPVIRPENTSVFSQFTIRVPDRDRVVAACQAAGIPTAVHYPIPLHHQPVLAQAVPRGTEPFPVAARAAERVLSLPMHPFLPPEQQDRVVAAVLQGIGKGG